MSKVYLTFEDMQNDPDADDTEATDIVLSANGFNGPIWWCPKHETWLPFKQFYLDLSPLQKFMGRRRYPHNGHITIQGDDDYYRCTRCHGRVGLEYRVEDRCSGVIGMYGMDYDFDWVPPAPSPEKSPQEKALDDFIAKRKAKREGGAPGYGWDTSEESTKAYRRERKEIEDGQALDRAMRRLSFHEQDIHTRLMPYRREE